MNKNTIWQAVKYGLFSLSAGLIQAGSFVLLYNVLLQEKWYSFCYILSLALSVLWNFTLNRKFTFQSANNVPLAMLQVACFYLVFTPLSAWAGQALESAGWNGNLVQLLTMAANFILEFLYFKWVVFRERKQDN